MSVRGLQFRFQHWVLFATSVLVLLLTAAFLLAVFGKFETMSEDNAKERLALIAQRSTAEIADLLRGVAAFAATQAGSEGKLFVGPEGINEVDLIATLIASLQASPNVYSHYFALADDDFVQVVAIRGDRRIARALQAPDDSAYAVRSIRRTVDGNRRERWRFLAGDRSLLGERLEQASYQPSGRPWFAGARQKKGPAITAPYLFSSTGRPGITLSAPLANADGVFGSDIDLGALADFLAAQPLTPGAAILMLDEARRVLAYHGRGAAFAGVTVAAMTPLAELSEPLFQALHEHRQESAPYRLQLGADGENKVFIAAPQHYRAAGGSTFAVVAIAPLADFRGPIDTARRDVLLLAAAILALLLPLAWLGSRRVVLALAELARNSELIKRFDFSTEPRQPASCLYEINTLAEAQAVMRRSIREHSAELGLAREKLARLVENGLMLARERDRDKMLRHILNSGREIANCAAGTLYLKTERNTLAFALRTNDDDLLDFEVPLCEPTSGEPANGYVSSYVAMHNRTVVIDDVYSETRFDLSGTKRFSEASGFRTVSMLTVPLSPGDGEVIGVLQLMNALDPESGEIIPFAAELVSFVEALAAQSAVALENHNLLAAQKKLMDSIIQMVAGAIDAKSAYTGGHCARVPELAVMLAEEACRVDEGPLAGFSFASEDEWREFRIGAWLHDCGKVTTPEYVVDKATKLETIYNRIHEIRTRFEVLLRDAEIDRLAAIAAGQAAADADTAFAARRQRLFEDFTFVAECNIGGEFMAPEDVDRLQRIGAQTWLRHFDDRLGLAHEELRRREAAGGDELPARERLLADKPWHVVPRPAETLPAPEFGFRMTMPEHLYDFGELHNLAIARGTLTDEERYKINEHIVQTIVMLDKLPFPKHLRRVPEYAATHHETLAGNGYPRRLGAAELSIPARIMAIADIFEALTASDRPYKKAKGLSEAVRILSFFKKDGHIDGDLFDLFLASGVYRRYGERYLRPEQLDAVDIARYLTPRPAETPAETAGV